MTALCPTGKPGLKTTDPRQDIRTEWALNPTLDFPALSPDGEAGLSGRPQDHRGSLWLLSFFSFIHVLISLFLTEG